MSDALGPVAESRRVLVRARLAVHATFFVSGATLGVWAAHIPVLKGGLGLDDSELGLVLLASGGGAVIAMPTAGALVHRFGAVPICVATGLLLALALALPPYATGGVALALAAALIGFGVGGIDIAMNAHAAAVERAWGRPIMSSIHAFFSIGGLAGGAAGAGMIGLGLHPPLGMGLPALALGAVIAVAGLHLRFGEDGPRDVGPAFRWPSAAVLGFGLLAVCSFLCEGAMMEWSAVFLRDVAGAPIGVAAAAYAAFSAAMTVGRLLGDRFVDHLGPARAVQVSGALSAAALAFVTLAPNPWVAYAGLLLAGLGFANIVPPLFSAVTRVPGVPPASALAMIASMGYGIGLVGPPMIGFVSDASSLRFGFAILVMAALVIAIGAPRIMTEPVSPPAAPRRG